MGIVSINPGRIDGHEPPSEGIVVACTEIHQATGVARFTGVAEGVGISVGIVAISWELDLAIRLIAALLFGVDPTVVSPAAT